jgi:hypothetical protein
MIFGISNVVSTAIEPQVATDISLQTVNGHERDFQTYLRYTSAKPYVFMISSLCCIGFGVYWWKDELKMAYYKITNKNEK